MDNFELHPKSFSCIQLLEVYFLYSNKFKIEAIKLVLKEIFIMLKL